MAVKRNNEKMKEASSNHKGPKMTTNHNHGKPETSQEIMEKYKNLRAIKRHHEESQESRSNHRHPYENHTESTQSNLKQMEGTKKISRNQDRSGERYEDSQGINDSTWIKNVLTDTTVIGCGPLELKLLLDCGDLLACCDFRYSYH